MAASPGLKRHRTGSSFEEPIGAEDESMVLEDGFMSAPSFSDIVGQNLGGTPLVCENVIPIIFEEDDVQITKCSRGTSITFSEKLKAQLYKPWQSALIIKIMGGSHSFNYFLQKLRQKWYMLKGYWRLIDIANGYYIVKFQLEEDLNYVLCEGPWSVTGRYLAIQKWKPGFNAEQDKITRLTVWIRITGLHVEWFEPRVLKCIGDTLGATHRVDMRTTTHARGQYARLCVEIDLEKPLQDTIQVEGVWYQIQYEGLNLVCFDCGMYGHDEAHCPTKVFKAVPSPLVTVINTAVTTAGCVPSPVTLDTQMVDETSSQVSSQLNEWNLVIPRRNKKMQKQQPARSLTPTLFGSGPTATSVVKTKSAVEWHSSRTHKSTGKQIASPLSLSLKPGSRKEAVILPASYASLLLQSTPIATTRTSTDAPPVLLKTDPPVLPCYSANSGLQRTFYKPTGVKETSKGVQISGHEAITPGHAEYPKFWDNWQRDRARYASPSGQASSALHSLQPPGVSELDAVPLPLVPLETS